MSGLSSSKRRSVRVIGVRANDPMPDLGKSINVFNNNPNVRNPFLRNGEGNSLPARSSPAPAQPHAPSGHSSSEE